MSLPGPDQVGMKINKYVQHLNQIREDEDLCRELAKNLPKGNHSYPNPEAEHRTLDVLRDLFLHWTRILRLPIADPAWMAVKYEIDGIDRKRGQNKAKHLKKMLDTFVFESATPPDEQDNEHTAEDFDPDQQHDLLLFADETDDDEPPASPILRCKRMKSAAEAGLANLDSLLGHSSFNLFSRGAIHDLLAEDDQ